MTFGKDRMVFGSDWPFPMGIIDVDGQLGFLSDEQRNRIYRENAAELALPAGKEHT